MLNGDTNEPPNNYKEIYILNLLCIVVKITNKYIEIKFAQPTLFCFKLKTILLDLRDNR